MLSPQFRRVPTLVFALGATLSSSFAADAGRESGKLYNQLCASCHGPQLAGAAGPSLLGPAWKYGGDDATIIASIRNGHPATGMPAFGETVSETELRSLVVFIREAGARAVERKTEFARPAENITAQSKLHAFRLETATGGLHEPWSIAFLPDGRTLVTEKNGALRVIENGVLRKEPVSGTPVVDHGGQAGLFDVVAHPDFAHNGWIYLSFADLQKEASGRLASMTTVVRGRIKDNAWVDEQVIFRAPISAFRNTGGIHYGGRIAFDREGFLYFSIGTRGAEEQAQDVTRPNGKIHRLYDDGRIPADNPFVKTPGADTTIWSYGHRNPQGLRLDPVTGELWETEHGPRGGDELNHIRKGLNYGWPLATFGMNYNGTPMDAVTTRADFEDSVVHWTPSIAPCGMAFYTGDKFPKWKNNLFVTSLAAQELRRIELKDGKAVDQEIIFKGIGRLRDVATGPDGFLYVLLPDRIARLVPVQP